MDRIVGADLGINTPITFSDSSTLVYPDEIKEMREQAKQMQKRLPKRRRLPPSRGYQQTLSRYRSLLKRIRQAKLDCIRAHAKKVCADNQVIVFEGLNLLGMLRSAKGTAKTPGKNVAAKKGLSRELGWVSFGTIIQVFCSEAMFTGTRVVLVDPKFSSCECIRCGYTDKENRHSQPVFLCVSCGYSSNADYNAALVIKQRGIQHIQRVADAALPQGTRRSRPGSGIIPVKEKPD